MRPVVLAFVLLLAALPFACAQSIAGVDPDGGEPSHDGGGSAPDASVVPGDASLFHPDASALSPDSGSLDSGSLPSDAGLAADAATEDAGLPPLSWGEATITTAMSAVNCLYTDGTDVYAAGSYGKVLKRNRSTGNFDLLKASVNGSSSDIQAMTGANGKLFVASGNAVGIYDGAGWTSVSLPSTAVVTRMRAASDREVYLSGSDSNSHHACVWFTDGTSAATQLWWDAQKSEAPGLLYSAGSLFISTDSLGVFRRKTGVTTAETVNPDPGWTSTGALELFGLGEVQGRLFAVGSRWLVFERSSASAQWSPVYSAFDPGELRSVAGFVEGDSSEAWAVGSPWNGTPMLRFDGRQWKHSDVPDSWDLWDVVAVNRDLWFAAGIRKSSVTGVLLAGSR